MPHKPSASVRVEPIAAAAAGPRRGDRPFWIALLIIELMVLLVHLNALRVSHIEGDEIIFTFLAERLGQQPLAYHLNGELEGAAARRFIRDAWEPRFRREFPSDTHASVLMGPDAGLTESPMYDLGIYGRPMFFHPPLYPYCLAAARAWFGSVGGIMLAPLFHGLTILFVALLGRMLANETTALIAAGLIAVEAVSWTCGERLWIDGMLEAAVSGAALAAVWSAQRGGVWRFALAGGCLGLAGLTKLPAGLLAPVVFVLWLIAPRRPQRGEVISFISASVILVAPWLVLNRAQLGAFLPSQHPTSWMLEHYEWVRTMVNRPAYFYALGLLFVSPILIYSVVGLGQIERQRWLVMPLTWAAAFFIAMTLIGSGGMGFQLRYVAPALPALCLLAAAGIQALPLRWRLPALALAAYTLFVGVETGLRATTVDPAPIALSHCLLDLLGWDLAKALPGMW